MMAEKMDTEVVTGESAAMISKEKTLESQKVMSGSSTKTIETTKADTGLTTDCVQSAEKMDNKVETGESVATVSKEKTHAPQNMNESSTQTIGSSKAHTILTTDCVQSEKTYSKFVLNIVILGTIGSGKATLANHIAKEELFTPQDVLAGREPQIRNKTSDSGNYAFLLIDTFGAFDVKNYLNLYTYQNIENEFMNHMSAGVNLIIFTVRKDCSSPDEIKVLNYIIKERLGENVDEHVALVITACEQIGLAKKNAFLKAKEETTADTKYLFNYASGQKGVHLTSFPNLDEAEDEKKASMREKIEASEMQLKRLLESCKTQLYFEEIFPPPKRKMKNWSLLPSKEVSPVCTQS